MKKFLLGVVLSVFFVTNSAFAMTFSQPVKIGGIHYSQVSRGGISFENATENDGSGTARFGDSIDSLYVHVHNNSYKMKFGAKNESNTITIHARVYFEIFKLASNERGNFFVIKDRYDLLESEKYILLGKKKDGTFVKYFDTEELRKKYFGKQWQGIWFRGIKAQDDMIIVHYQRNLDGRKMQIDSADERGEFRFKWDERAQWFGVEHIVY